MRRLATGLAVAAIACTASAAQGQTLRMMKSLDAPHYDGQRTTWSPSADIVNMIQDTLVALDWDGKTVIPYLAKSWQISEDEDPEAGSVFRVRGLGATGLPTPLFRG